MPDSLPYQALYELALNLHKQDLGAHKIMQIILANAGKIAGLDQGFLVAFNSDDTVSSALVLANNTQTEVEPGEMWETLLARGLVGYVYHGQRTVIIHNIQTDPRWPALPDAPYLPKTGSAVGIPLVQGTEVFGAMLFLHPDVGFFSGRVVDLLEEIARLGAAALNRAWDFVVSGKGVVRYQTLFDDAVVPMILSDLNGTIVSANHKACEMLGYERHELLLKSITSINSIEMKKIGEGGLQALEFDHEITIQSEVKTAGNETIPVLLRLRRLQIGGGNLLEWVEQDISPQMELQQLRQDLAAMVYHDLRGPLQGISASFQKLAQVLARHENPAIRSLLQIGNRSARQLRRMIDSLLDVQRLEEGSAILDRNPIEIRVVLADAVQLVQPIAFESGQKIKLEVEKDLPIVNIDNEMIIRVVINLIENAVKYTPNGGSILVSARTDGQMIRVSVKDSGPGIPENYRRSIFDKFNRINHRNAPQGVGLGLAFCRLAIKGHNGEIWVESEEGSGSEFIFTLPINSADEGNDQLDKLISTA